MRARTRRAGPIRGWQRVAVIALALVGLGANATSAAAIVPLWVILPAADWTQDPAAGAPPAESFPVRVADDPATGQLVVYDPAVSALSCAIPGANAMWVWDGAAWTNPLTGKGPNGRVQPTLVYDGSTRQVIMFGGSSSEYCDTGPPTYLDDTWAWNGDHWSQLHPAVSPPVGEGGCAAYDAATHQVVMFGNGTGINSRRVGDPNTWTWDGTTWTPHLLTPAPPTSTFACGMTYDAARQTLVLQSDGDVVSTWEWNGASWTQRASGGPELNSQSNADIAYDAATNQVLLYNGSVSCFPQGGFGSGDCWFSASQTWAWNGSSWQQLAPGTEPTSRNGATLGYDAATQQLVLFGGYAPATLTAPPSYLANTWVYGAHATSPVTPQRVAGPDRDATAVAVSYEEFPTPQSAAAVVLARGDEFADALTGGPLAVTKKGPLLLTPSSSLDPITSAEISRVLAPGGTVYLMGGTSALSNAVQTQVSALGFAVVRIAGADRYDTAVQVANAIGNPTVVLEASGIDFPDALAAGPAASAEHAAILLTTGSSQSIATAAYLAGHPGTRYAIGRPAATADPSATALVGADRYATSAAVARAFFPTATSFGVASGVGFADALAGGSWSGAQAQPLLLVPPSGALPEPVGAFLATRAAGVNAVEVFGGPAAVIDTVMTELSSALAVG